MTVNAQFAPDMLNKEQKSMVVYLFSNKKAAKIISILCDKEGAYMNQIHDVVGGSKTSTVEILKALEGIQVVKSEWEINEMVGKDSHKTRAVRTFRLSKEREKLIKFYEPLFKLIG